MIFAKPATPRRSAPDPIHAPQPQRAFRLAAIFGYAILFVLLHRTAAHWAMGGLFSLWFPAAGLRFALLWRLRARWAPLIVLAELVSELAAGEVAIGRSPLLELTGIVGPCCVYALVIYLVKARAGRRTPMLRLAPLPFALAAVIGPISACIAALPWAIPSAALAGPVSARTLVSALLVFSLGDMLGVLIVAPPLLWLSARLEGAKSWRIKPPRPLLCVEFLLVTATAWGVVWAISWTGLGLLPVPVLLSTCWTGLRGGRAGAWSSILIAAAIVLPMTEGASDSAQRLGLHMLLAGIAAIGYLAGSFAEAEARSQSEIRRRDRILYQAERLKTLRAMSVAVIHEISQPLSTVAIEANHLVAATAVSSPDLVEIAQVSQLIARKVQDLSQMVRRLRRFGDRIADAPSPIPMSLLLSDLAAIAAPEARAAQVILEIEAGGDDLVRGQDVELRQALLNLLRNAVAASTPSGIVRVTNSVAAERVRVAVVNEIRSSGFARPGMGIGLMIARSIAEAHGGTIVEDRPHPEQIRFTLDLPLAGALHV